MQHEPPEYSTPPTRPPTKPERSRRPRGSGKNGNGHLTKFDKTISGKRVRITLAVEGHITNDQGIFVGIVEEVDRYFIRMSLSADKNSTWINKSAIACLSVL